MKKFKIALWLILIILLFLVFFQNKAFLLGKQALMLDFFVVDALQSAALPIGIWLLLALCIGFLFAYILSLIEKLKTGRLVKALKAQTTTQTEMITQLKKELDNRVGFPPDEVVNAEPIGSASTDI